MQSTFFEILINLFKSLISPNSIFTLFFAIPSLLKFPLMFESKQITFTLLWTSFLIIADPINPVPPVIRYVFFFF